MELSTAARILTRAIHKCTGFSNTSKSVERMNVNALLNHHCPYCDVPILELRATACPHCGEENITWIEMDHKLLPTGEKVVCVKSSEADRARRLVPTMLDMRQQNDENAYATPSAEASRRVYDDEQSGVMWLLLSKDGRIGRRKFLLGHLAFWIIAVLLVFLLESVLEGSEDIVIFWGLLFAIFYLAAWIGLNVKRLHDMDLPGTWCFVVLIPLGGLILKLVCLFHAPVNTDGDYNRFGKDPRK